MFEGLQKKWKVSSVRLLLILLTFAIGGSLTGYLGRKLMLLMGIENTVVYILVYIIMITLLWPLMVLAVSVPFGQFSFFKKYIRKIAKRVGISNTEQGM